MMNSKKMHCVIVFFMFLFACTICGANAQEIVLDQSQPLVATSNQIQRFSESIDLKKGQEKLNLTLTYYNGSATAPGYKWLRISSASMRYVTEQSFQGQKSYSVDVTGELTWGGNQLLITAEGPRGATLTWKLTTESPSVTGISPNKLTPGAAIAVMGNNFSTDPAANDVMIGGHEAHCLSATRNKLIVQVPEYVDKANSEVTVSVAGMEAGTLMASADVMPAVTSLSASWVAPGSQFTIYGTGFSPAAQSNVVYIGPLKAEVVSASATSITVIAPVDFGGEPWGYYQPVKVTVNGIRARGNLTISVSQVG